MRLAFKAAWKDGTHAVLLDPLDLIARRFHMVRYHGVLAAHSERARRDRAPAPAAGLLCAAGTQVHVIAFSPKEVSMDVLAGKEAATTMRSSYQREVTNGPAKVTLAKVGGEVPLESDSRQIEMKPGTPLQVKMRGQGCAGVVVFSKR